MINLNVVLLNGPYGPLLRPIVHLKSHDDNVIRKLYMKLSYHLPRYWQ